MKKHAKPLVSILFPVLGAHICAVKFQYPDLIWKESCGITAVSPPKSGVSMVLKRRVQLLKMAFTAGQNGGLKWERELKRNKVTIKRQSPY